MGIEVGELIFSGAEARVYRGSYHGRPCIVKERFAKDYRLERLDLQLRSKRMIGEAKSLMRCRNAGVRAPCVYHVDMHTMTLYIEEIQNSRPLREVIDRTDDPMQLAILAAKVGETVANVHNVELVHGDLTTSNLMCDATGLTYVIDFGLSTKSNLPEDFAVDLYVLERAVESTHSGKDGFCSEVMASYKRHANKAAKTLERLEKVKARGRKRSMVG